MDELVVAECDRVRPLFEQIDYQRPSVFPVLEGTQAGRVFVDRRARPAAALIWSDACYLAGCASDAAFNADLLNLLRTEVMPRMEHLLIYVQRLGFTNRREVEVTYLLVAQDKGLPRQRL